MNNNKVFVTGATGFQGGKISTMLIENGYNVVTIAPQTVESSEIKSGLQIINGDLEDKATIKEALKGVTKSVYTFPLIFDMEKAISYTNNFIDAAKETGLELIVFNTSFHLPKSDTGFLSLDLKRKIGALFSESGLNVITLMPDIYMDNLIAPWMKPLIVDEGIIPYPIAENQKVPWISQSDLGRAVCKVLEIPSLIGQTLPIGGNIYTGKEISQIISKEINKEVKFIALTPNDFENQLVAGFGELAAKEISNLYRYVEANTEVLSSKDFRKTNDILGIKPESFEDFITKIDW